MISVWKWVKTNNIPITGRENRDGESAKDETPFKQKIRYVSNQNDSFRIPPRLSERKHEIPLKTHPHNYQINSLTLFI